VITPWLGSVARCRFLERPDRVIHVNRPRTSRAAAPRSNAPAGSRRSATTCAAISRRWLPREEGRAERLQPFAHERRRHDGQAGVQRPEHLVWTPAAEAQGATNTVRARTPRKDVRDTQDS